MVYAYKSNSRIKVPAQIAGEMCEKIAKTGELTPKRLLDANREEGTPLHNEFEWDDSIAAEAYREDQAAHIIRCIIIKPEKNEATPTRAFVRVTESTGNYTHINVVLSDEELMERLITSAWKEMECFTKKYSGIKKLNKVIAEMNEALKSTG
ncbi:MAG: hypothetical protein LIO87_05655 [Eubacterium sp.]|nr:hypothetical protein [Eubacterium sp.]